MLTMIVLKLSIKNYSIKTVYRNCLSIGIICNSYTPKIHSCQKLSNM